MTTVIKEPAREGDWLQTASGLPAWPCDPRVGDFLMRDIAHHLSHQGRFSGATRDFYSVAQHSVFVARQFNPGERLPGLLHDATEAYLVDLPSPIKRGHAMLGTAHAELEDALAEKIEATFGLSIGATRQADVRRVDLCLLETEARDLMKVPPVPWLETGVAPLDERLVAWSPLRAHVEFLRIYYAELVAQVCSPTTPKAARWLAIAEQVYEAVTETRGTWAALRGLWYLLRPMR